MPLAPDIEEKLKRTGAAFLAADVETALIFVQLARSANHDLEKRLRNQANARKAHDTVQHLAARLHLSPEQQSEVHEKLKRLKTELEALGEQF